MTRDSLESKCMFYEESKCFFHASYPTTCRLCFNFSTGYKVLEKGKIKPFYTMYDYLEFTHAADKIFPKGAGIQQTL